MVGEVTRRGGRREESEVVGCGDRIWRFDVWNGEPFAPTNQVRAVSGGEAPLLRFLCPDFEEFTYVGGHSIMIKRGSCSYCALGLEMS